MMVNLVRTSEPAGRLVLQSLVAVLTGAGADPLTPEHLKTLQAIQEFILQTEIAPETVPDSVPENLASQFGDDQLIQQTLFLCTLMPYTEERLDARKVATVTAIWRSLGIPRGPRWRDLDDLARGRLRRLQLRLMKPLMQRYFKAPLPVVLYKFIELRFQFGEATRIPPRLRALGTLAQGTVGRTLFEYYEETGLPYPGSPGGLPPLSVLQHDVQHIFTGLDTSHVGEIALQAFITGNLDREPLEGLAPVLMLYHMGLELIQKVTPSKGYYEAASLFRALEAGALADSVLTTPGWDFWPLMAQPLATARLELGLPEQGVSRRPGSPWLDPEDQPMLLGVQSVLERD